MAKNIWKINKLNFQDYELWRLKCLRFGKKLHQISRHKMSRIIIIWITNNLLSFSSIFVMQILIDKFCVRDWLIWEQMEIHAQTIITTWLCYLSAIIALFSNYTILTTICFIFATGETIHNTITQVIFRNAFSIVTSRLICIANWNQNWDILNFLLFDHVFDLIFLCFLCLRCMFWVLKLFHFIVDKWADTIFFCKT